MAPRLLDRFATKHQAYARRQWHLCGESKESSPALWQDRPRPPIYPLDRRMAVFFSLEGRGGHIVPTYIEQSCAILDGRPTPTKIAVDRKRQDPPRRDR